MKKLLTVTLTFVVTGLCAQVYQSILIQMWNNNAWVTSGKMTNTVDVSGYVIYNIQETWTPSNSAWVPMVQSHYTNTTAGLVSQYTFDNWDTSTNSWQLASGAQYTYNSNNKQLVVLYLSASGNNLVNNGKEVSSYDANGFLISGLSSAWNGTAWTPVAQVTYTNDANGNPLEYIAQNYVSNAWVNSVHMTYTYNTQNQLTDHIYQSWSGTAWDNLAAGKNVYDQSGVLIETDYFSWNNNAWFQDQKHNYTYNSNGTLNYVTVQLPGGSGGWVNNSKTIYSWFPGTATGINELRNLNETPTVYFDLNGRRVEKQWNTVLIEQRGFQKRKVMFVE